MHPFQELTELSPLSQSGSNLGTQEDVKRGDSGENSVDARQDDLKFSFVPNILGSIVGSGSTDEKTKLLTEKKDEKDKDWGGGVRDEYEVGYAGNWGIETIGFSNYNRALYKYRDIPSKYSKVLRIRNDFVEQHGSDKWIALIKKKLMDEKMVRKVREKSGEGRDGPLNIFMEKIWCNRSRGVICYAELEQKEGTGPSPTGVKVKNLRYGDLLGVKANVSVKGTGRWHYEVTFGTPCSRSLLFGWGTEEFCTGKSFIPKHAALFGIWNQTFCYKPFGFPDFVQGPEGAWGGLELRRERFRESDTVAIILDAATNEMVVRLNNDHHLTIPAPTEYRGKQLWPVGVLEQWQAVVFRFDPNGFRQVHDVSKIPEFNLGFTEAEKRQLILQDDDKLSKAIGETKHQYIRQMLMDVFDFLDEDRTGVLDAEEVETAFYFLFHEREKLEWEDEADIKDKAALFGQTADFKEWVRAMKEITLDVQSSAMVPSELKFHLPDFIQAKLENESAGPRRPTGIVSSGVTQEEEKKENKVDLDLQIQKERVDKENFIRLYYSSVPELAKYLDKIDKQHGEAELKTMDKKTRDTKIQQLEARKSKRESLWTVFKPTTTATLTAPVPTVNDSTTGTIKKPVVVAEVKPQIKRDPVEKRRRVLGELSHGKVQLEEDDDDLPLLRLHYFESRLLDQRRAGKEQTECECVDCCCRACECCGQCNSSCKELCEAIGERLLSLCYLFVMPFVLLVYLAHHWNRTLPPRVCTCYAVAFLFPGFLLSLCIYYISFISILAFYNEYGGDYSNISFLEVWMPFLLFVVISFVISVYFTNYRRILSKKERWEIGGDMEDEQKRLSDSMLATKTLTIHRFGQEKTEVVGIDEVIKDIEPKSQSVDCLEVFLQWGAPSIFAFIQAVLPGIYRLCYGEYFFGSTEGVEITVVILYMILSPPSLFIICAWMHRLLVQFEVGVVSQLRNISAVCSPKGARDEHLPFYIDLAEDQNIPRWISLRSAVQTTVNQQAKNAAENLLPILVFILSLAVVIFIRVFIILTPDEFDIFNLIAAYHIIVLSLYVARLLLKMATANGILDGDSFALKSRRYSLAKEAQADKDHDGQRQKTNTLRLLEVAVDQVDATTLHVEIFGYVVTQQQVNQLIGIASASVLSALTTLINAIVSRRTVGPA